MSDANGVSPDRISTKRSCADIRASDEISFKLMGLVPVATGSAFLALMFVDKNELAGPDVVFQVSTSCGGGHLGTLQVGTAEYPDLQMALGIAPKS